MTRPAPTPSPARAAGVPPASSPSSILYPPSSPFLPLPAAALALLAMFALYITSKGYAGLVPLAVALLATYATSSRLRPSPLLAWAIRVIVFGAILVTANPEKRADVGSLAFDPGYTNLFGALCAGELVIRTWIRRKNGPSKGEILLLSTLIFTAATNATDMRSITWIRTLAPIFLALLVLTLRRFRPRPRGSAGIAWLAPLLLVLAIGWTASWAVANFENQITRWSMQFLSPNRRPSGSIGIGRNATLGRVFNPTPSAVRVLKIENWPGEHHMRAVAFDNYADGTWGPPADQREFSAPPSLSLPIAPTRDAHLTRYGDAYGLLCVPLNAAALHLAAENVEIQQSADGSLRTANDPAVPDPLDYTLAIGDDTAQGLPARPLTEDQRRWDLVIPKGIDPRVPLLAKQIAPGTDPRENLVRITHYLQTNHKYSLEIDPGDGDPISAFLLKKLDGHCEYFAASVVILARSVGIPSRFASGFYAHEPAGDNTTVVRERDAHAWAECWIDGTGWVTVDATPASGRPDALFTQTPAWRRYWERAQDTFAAVRAWLGRRTLLEGAAMIAVLAAIPVFIRVFKSRGTKQRKRAAVAYAPTTKELADLARRFERALRRRGVTVEPHRTWSDHAAKVDGGADFVRAYNALRFGGEGSVEQLKRMLHHLET